MVHTWDWPPGRSETAPRARGDGPHVQDPLRSGGLRAPRVAGDGEALLPAHAGMVPAAPLCGSYQPAAPRARGDGPEPGLAWVAFGVALLPAHAGMVPQGEGGRLVRPSAPRARGDGP